MFEIVSGSGAIPYFIFNLFLIATLIAAADQEPDEEQEEEQQQEGTNHRPDYDTHLIGSWKNRNGVRFFLCQSEYTCIHPQSETQRKQLSL